MRDWKAMAKALGIDDGAVDPLVEPLEALERAFQPLAASLTPEIEPALEFRAEENE